MIKRKSATDFETPTQARSNSNAQKLAFTSGLEASSPTKGGTEAMKALTSVDIVQLTKYEEAVLNSPRSGINSHNWRNSNQSGEQP
jgi:hypothetical protein